MAVRYWVASASGNWVNSANWSDSSGGPGGNSVPGIGDTAIFDAGGLGSCTITSAVVFSFSGVTPTANALESLQARIGYTGTLDFSSLGVTINSVSISKQCVVSNLDGTVWSLRDPLFIEGNPLSLRNLKMSTSWTVICTTGGADYPQVITYAEVQKVIGSSTLPAGNGGISVYNGTDFGTNTRVVFKPLTGIVAVGAFITCNATLDGGIVVGSLVPPDLATGLSCGADLDGGVVLIYPTFAVPTDVSFFSYGFEPNVFGDFISSGPTDGWVIVTNNPDTGTYCVAGQFDSVTQSLTLPQVFSAAGTITFRRAWIQPTLGTYTFLIDGVPKEILTEADATQSYQTRTYPVTAGARVFTWQWLGDASNTVGNGPYIDNVSCLQSVSVGGSLSLVGGTESGDVLDYRDPAKLLLTVDGTPIDFTSPYFNIRDFNFSYDGKEVTFTEIPTLNYGASTFNDEDEVTLEMDLGSGMKTWFRGKIKKTTHSGANNNEEIVYSCYGHQNNAADLDLLNAYGYPAASFVSYVDVADVIATIFSNNAANLALNGIPSTIGTPGTGTFNVFTLQNLTFENEQFTTALRQVISRNQPTKRLFFDDLQNAWCFPDVAAADIKVLNIDLANVDSHSYTLDSTNRFTALLAYTTLQGNAVYDSRDVIALEPDWAPGLEADWTARKGVSVAIANQFGDAYAKVFRKWKIPSSSTFKENDSEPVGFFVLVNYWRRQVWVPIQAKIDLEAKTIFAHVPVIRAGNPHVPGDAKGPLAAAFVYIDYDNIPLSGPAFIRVPESGYTGTAYDLYGVARLKKMFIDPQSFGPINVAAQLQILKDVLFTAELPLFGDPIETFANLQCRVRLTDTTRSTGVDTIQAMLLKYSYTFGKPGKSVLSLTTDKSIVTRLE